MTTNGGCELPCWWGIVPGQASFEATQDELALHGFWVGGASASGPRGSDDFGVYLEFEVDDGLIQAARVSGSYLQGTPMSEQYRHAFARGWQRYSLAEILSRYGIPTEVFIYSPFQADRGDGPAYHLLVFYENLGIEIDYLGAAQSLGAGYFRACPDLNDIHWIQLFLFQADQVDNPIERVLPASSVSYIAGPDTVYERISWQHATGTTLQHFYNTFSVSGGSCIDFSTD
jgi:hypothetical protein